MTIKVAINGYGRIGRNTLRAIFEENKQEQIEVVAINDVMGNINVAAHLTQYDSVHGPFPADVKVDGSDLSINGKLIKLFNERDPLNLPWQALGIDVVYECTGVFTSGGSCQAHLQAGAKKVLISAPANEVDCTVVFGVNEKSLKSSDVIISNASCTTNCLAPLAKLMNDHLGIERGNMLTIHSYTNDQVLTDLFHTDLRRARSATSSMIPTTTGAASSIGLVIPELSAKLSGYAVRVPTTNVSMIVLDFLASHKTTVQQVNDIVKHAADGKIMRYNELPLVSIDFNHSSYSCNFDATLTQVNDNFVSISAYYDNEWAFSCRMLDTSLAMMDHSS